MINISDLLKETRTKILENQFLDRFKSHTFLKNYILDSFELMNNIYDYKLNPSSNSFKNFTKSLLKEFEQRNKLNNGNVQETFQLLNKLSKELKLIDKDNDRFELDKINHNTILIYSFGILKEIYPESFGSEHLDIIIDDLKNLNDFRVIKDEKEYYNLKSSINNFSNFAKIDQENIANNYHSLVYYPNSTIEKELYSPALNLNQYSEEDINKNFKYSQETLAWLAYWGKTIKQSADLNYEDLIKDWKEKEPDFAELDVIEELEEAIKNKDFVEFLDIDFSLPTSLQKTIGDMIQFNADHISNIIDNIDLISGETILDGFISTSTSALELIEEGTDTFMDNIKGPGYSMIKNQIKDYLKTIWNVTPTSVKDIFFYSEIKERIDSIKNTISDYINKKIGADELKEKLTFELKMFAKTKEQLLKELGNNTINQTIESLIKLGEKQSLDTNMYEIYTQDFDDFENRFENLFSNKIEINESQFKYDLISLYSSKEYNKIINIFKNIKGFDDLSNNDILKIGYKYINNDDKLGNIIVNNDFIINYKLDKKYQKMFIEFKEHNIIPNMEELEQFLIDYEDKKEDLLFFSKDLYSIGMEIYTKEYLNLNNKQEDMMEDIFIQRLLSQIDNPTVLFGKKEIYLESFLSINNDKQISDYNKDYSINYFNKNIFFQQSIEELEKRINLLKEKPNKKNDKLIKKMEQGIEAIIIMQDIVKLEKIKDSGELIFINDQNKTSLLKNYFCERFNIDKYINSTSNNHFIMELQEKFLSDVNETINDFQNKNFNNRLKDVKFQSNANKNKALEKINELKDKNIEFLYQMSSWDQELIEYNIGDSEISLILAELNPDDINIEVESLAEEINSYDKNELYDILSSEMFDPSRKDIGEDLILKRIHNQDSLFTIRKVVNDILKDNNILIHNLSYFDKDINESYTNLKELNILNNLRKSKNTYSYSDFLTIIIDDYFRNINIDGNKFKTSNIDNSILKLIVFNNYDLNRLLIEFQDKTNDYLRIKRGFEDDIGLFSKTKNELLIDIIKKDSINNGNLLELEALKLLEKTPYILKPNENIDKKDWEFLNPNNKKEFFKEKHPIDMFYAKHETLNHYNLKVPMISLEGLSKNDLLLINKSKYAKEYLINLFTESMNNPVDYNILKFMKNGNLENIFKNFDYDLDELRKNFKSFDISIDQLQVDHLVDGGIHSVSKNNVWYKDLDKDFEKFFNREISLEEIKSKSSNEIEIIRDI